jgi:hypothetical protein
MRLAFRLTAFFFFIAPACGCYAAESVSSFIDAYEKAIEGRGSLTARVSCKYYTPSGLVLPKEINGIITFGGFAEPFSIMTLHREEQLVDQTEAGTILVSGKSDRIRMADSLRAFYYDENAACMGASLVSARLDDLFLILMYPGLMDNLRTARGSVKEETVGLTRLLRLKIKSSSHFEFVVDADTRAPVKMERMGVDADGSTVRVVMMFAETHAAERRPPDVLFDVNLIFGFPQRKFDPAGLFALGAVPNFDANMLDGRTYSLASSKGKAVVLCFRGAEDTIGFSRDLYLDKAGDMARKRGGVFIDVYPSVSAQFNSVEGAYSAANTCRNDLLARLFSVNLKKTPTIVLITPEGRVGEVMSGYIPGVTERALDTLLNAWLAPVPALDGAPAARLVQ